MSDAASQFLRRLTLLCIAFALGGCAGQQRAPSKRSSLIEGTDLVRRFASPARWHYHPRQAADLRTRLELGSGDALFAGGRGERWFFDAKHKRVSAASQLASETLIAVLALPDRRWLFVGESGTGYEAGDPLGQFLRSNPPVDPLEQVSAHGSSIAGVRFDGALIQTTDAGLTWRRVPHENRYFADVELGEAGVGVAFAVPEAWYATRDTGQTWTELDVQNIGAVELRQDPKAGIVALGATSWFDVSPTAGQAFSPRRAGPVDQGHELPVTPPRGPDASALAQRRALLSGSRYLEVTRDQQSRSPWVLLSGALGEALSERSLRFASDCEALRLAGFEKTLYVACFKAEPKDSAVPTEFHVSHDQGKTFRREGFTVRAKLSDFGMAVGANSRLVVSGICSPQDSSRGCAPHGVYHKRVEEPKDKQLAASAGPGAKQPRNTLALSAVPGLAQTPMAMTFSADGRIAYLVGQRTKGDSYTMFVSRDQGETFRAREIEQLGARPRASGSAPWYRRRKVADAVLEMKAADDGTLSVVIRRGDQVALAVTDDDGRVLSLTPGPGESTILGAYGTHALALAPDSGKAWETLDGGVSWQAIGSLPVGLCEKGSECNVELGCGVAGCVVGDQLTRIGWRGQVESERGLPGPPESLTSGLLYPRVKTPINCTLADDEWKRLQGVSDAPSAHEAAIGATAWHLHGSDPDSAAVWAYHGKAGRRPQVVQTTLLSPAATPAQTAFAVFDQIEGAAALRYSVPRSGTGQHEISNIEVAWDNRFEDVVKRASLGRRLPFRSGDFAAQKARTQLARPDIVSIGVGGVYLRPHHQAADDQVTYFLDGHKVEQIPPVQWPGSPLAGRSEMVHAGGEHLPIRLQANGATLTRARWNGSHWNFASMTIGMPDPKSFGLLQHTGITYHAGGSAFYVVNFAASGSPRSGLAFPVQASGAVSAAPSPIPQQLDLADPPVACNEDQRTGSARVVVPYQAGTRHPITISHRIEPIRTLLSVEAVLHGSPQAPCLAALSAVPVDMDEREDRTWMYAVILPGELDNAWAFRVVYDDAGDKQVSYRNMRCEFDPKASVPKKVYAEPGTLSSEP